MSAKQFVDDVTVFLKAGYQLLVVPTNEPAEAEKAIVLAAQEWASGDKSTPAKVYTWNMAAGFESLTKAAQSIDNPAAKSPLFAVNLVASSDDTMCVYMMRNLHWALDADKPTRQRLLNAVNDRQLNRQDRKACIVLLQPSGYLPPDVAPLAQLVRFDLPDQAELAAITEAVHKSSLPALKAKGRTSTFTPELGDRLQVALQGLTRHQAGDTLARCLVTNGNWASAMVNTVKSQKAELFGQSGSLTYIPDHMIPPRDGLVGFENAVQLVELAAEAYTATGRACNLDLPKGIAMLGPPGTGKTQFAKLTAAIFRDICGQAFPIYWVNVGSLFGSLVGQSEAAMDNLLSTLNAHRGCIAVFDEFEKTIGQTTGGNDGGVSNRLRGRLLQWMSEERRETFVIVTMNGVAGVAPEFFRRFDATLATDLPDTSGRVDILKLHLQKRGVDPVSLDMQDVDWEAVAKAADEFAGSELEDAVVLARRLAHHRRKVGNPTSDELLEAIRERSRSTMAKIQADVLKEIREFCGRVAQPVKLAKTGKARTGRAMSL